LDRSPIFAAIGPSEEVSSGKLESGYQAFYHELLKTRDINKAMDTFNEKKPGMANSFILVSLTMLS